MVRRQSSHSATLLALSLASIVAYAQAARADEDRPASPQGARSARVAQLASTVPLGDDPEPSSFTGSNVPTDLTHRELDERHEKERKKNPPLKCPRVGLFAGRSVKGKAYGTTLGFRSVREIPNDSRILLKPTLEGDVSVTAFGPENPADGVDHYRVNADVLLFTTARYNGKDKNGSGVRTAVGEVRAIYDSRPDLDALSRGIKVTGFAFDMLKGIDGPSLLAGGEIGATVGEHRQNGLRDWKSLDMKIHGGMAIDGPKGKVGYDASLALRFAGKEEMDDRGQAIATIQHKIYARDLLKGRVDLEASYTNEEVEYAHGMPVGDDERVETYSVSAGAKW